MRRLPIICIVDDDDDVRSSLKNFLRSAGIDVRVFGSAEEFLASDERSGIDCLITDLHMEGMDGLALQEMLNGQHRSFPVIVMTAFPTQDTEERSMRLGASAYLVKPVDPDMLLDRVERMLA